VHATIDYWKQTRVKAFTLHDLNSCLSRMLGRAGNFKVHFFWSTACSFDMMVKVSNELRVNPIGRVVEEKLTDVLHHGMSMELSNEKIFGSQNMSLFNLQLTRAYM
jgi:hypothetical protein